MWHDVHLRVQVNESTVTWAASIASARRAGFGRTAREALFDLEQKVSADTRGEDLTTASERDYFARAGTE